MYRRTANRRNASLTLRVEKKNPDNIDRQTTLTPLFMKRGTGNVLVEDQC
jgi:hypothetical protein